MKLSIITINYNNLQGLRKTYQSVVSQTWQDFEWIVIDGGSTDGSKEFIEEHQAKFSYWVSEPDKGIYNAMNKGIGHAHGEWLQFINSGDGFVNDSVLEQVMRINTNADFVYGNTILTKNGKQVSINEYPGQLHFSQLYWESISHNSTFIRRDLFSTKKYNENNRIVSDWEFFIEQAMNNARFIHVDLPICFFDMSGISSTNRDMVLKEREDVLKRLVPMCIQEDMIAIDQFNIAFADGQLKKIDLFRRRNRFFRFLVSVFVRMIDIVMK